MGPELAGERLANGACGAKDNGAWRLMKGVGRRLGHAEINLYNRSGYATYLLVRLGSSFRTLALTDLRRTAPESGANGSKLTPISNAH